MKNSSIILSVMTFISLTIFSNAYSAAIVTKDIELLCGTKEQCLNADSPKYIQIGNPKVTLSVETLGIREKGIDGITEVKKGREVGKKGGFWIVTGTESRVYIEATCNPSRSNFDIISLSGSAFTCPKGEGMMIKMAKPYSEDPDQFHAVLRLTEQIDDDPVEEVKEPEVKNPEPVAKELKKRPGYLEYWKREGKASKERELRGRGFSQADIERILLDIEIELTRHDIATIENRIARRTHDQNMLAQEFIREMAQIDRDMNMGAGLGSTNMRGGI